MNNIIYNIFNQIITNSISKPINNLFSLDEESYKYDLEIDKLNVDQFIRWMILFFEIVISIVGVNFGEFSTPASELKVVYSEVENTRALGMVLYTKYGYLFQCAGMILLVAMIGAIVLTHRQRASVRRQKVGKQILRNRDDSVEIKKVELGKGAT